MQSEGYFGGGGRVKRGRGGSPTEVKRVGYPVKLDDVIQQNGHAENEGLTRLHRRGRKEGQERKKLGRVRPC